MKGDLFPVRMGEELAGRKEKYNKPIIELGQLIEKKIPPSDFYNHLQSTSD
jgi:hypothetical protein